MSTALGLLAASGLFLLWCLLFVAEFVLIVFVPLMLLSWHGRRRARRTGD